MAPGLLQKLQQQQLDNRMNEAKLQIAQSGLASRGQPKAPTGFLFNDPNDPAKGVRPLPGFIEARSRLAAAGAPRGATINVGSEVGTIPQGFELFTDPETGARRLQPIAGGPVALEQQQAARQASQRRQGDSTKANVVIQDIDRAIEKINQSPATTTGIGGAVLQNVPGTDARDVQGLINTVKANAGFDKLQAMRDASPTGGALGQVSNIELNLLMSAIGELEQSQGKEQLLFNLRRVREIYSEIIHGPGAMQSGGNLREMSDEELLKQLEN
jgi:hypothetical protein